MLFQNCVGQLERPDLIGSDFSKMELRHMICEVWKTFFCKHFPIERSVLSGSKMAVLIAGHPVTRLLLFGLSCTSGYVDIRILSSGPEQPWQLQLWCMWRSWKNRAGLRNNSPKSIQRMEECIWKEGDQVGNYWFLIVTNKNYKLAFQFLLWCNHFCSFLHEFQKTPQTASLFAQSHNYFSPFKKE